MNRKARPRGSRNANLRGPTRTRGVPQRRARRRSKYRALFNKLVPRLETYYKEYAEKAGITAGISVLLLFILFHIEFGRAATYLFTQTDWSSSSAATAAHPGDQSNWTQYSTSSNVTASTTIRLSTATTSLTQTDDGTTNTGFNLTGNSLSQTAVSGAGNSASVKLTSSAGGWTQTETGMQSAKAVDIAVDSTYAYIFGDENNQWRVEKRLLSDGSLVGGFGTDGILKFNPGGPGGGPGGAKAIQIDANYMYLYGNLYAEDPEWGPYNIAFIEKRSLATGALDANFNGNGWLSISGDAYDMILYGGAIYTAEGGSDWFIHKINPSNGSYVSAFGSSGQRILSKAGQGVENPYAMAADATGLYITGPINTSNDVRLYKLDLTTGNVTFQIQETIGLANLMENIAIDSSGIYIYGYVGGDGALMVEKRSLTDGSLINSFGSSGIVTLNPTVGQMDLARDIVVSSDGLIMSAVAYDRGYIAKIDSTTGALVSNFGSSGEITTPSFVDPNALIADASSFYPVGCSSCSTSWTMEKRSLSSGSTSATYNTPGTFTSGPIDIGGNVLSWGALSWNQTGGQTITIKARSADNSSMTGATDWASCSNITNGANLSTGNCVTSGHRYIQYQAYLATSDTAVSPSLDQVTVSYTAYAASGYLISSAYDAGDDTNVMSEISWTEDASLPASSTVTVSVRTAATSGGLTSSSWTDLLNNSSNCSKSDTRVTCLATALPSNLRDSLNDRWFQYKVSLAGNSASSPTVDDISVKYVVNAPPEFNPAYGTNGITARQVATSSDPDWGKISISYSVRDTDTTTGSSTPNYITPSFEYNIGGGWIAINSNLSAGALTNKAVAQVAFNDYPLTWDVQAALPGQYTSNAQIRVTANDNEPANNIARATSTSFILDTKAPTASATLNIAAGTISFSAADDTNITYQLSNNSDLSSDGVNPTSGQWVPSGTTSTAGSGSWTAANPGGYPTAYFKARDAYNNSASIRIVAPYVPQNMDLKDVSNVPISLYKEFVSWGVYVSTTSAQFAKYEVYRSVNGSAYTLVSTLTDSAVNYYVDSDLASSTTYSYRVRTVDAEGDISGEITVSDVPDGASADGTGPVISNVTSSQIQSSWAKIIWSTDELSNSEVDYSVAPSTAFDRSATAASFVTAHEVVLTGLTPNTSYLFKIKSKDVSNNSSEDTNGGNGYAFTTPGGPIISDVTAISVGEHQATITWNTNSDSDSFVRYATSSALVDAIETGSSELVSGSTSSLRQHRVTLSGLGAATTYYYSVKSTDGSQNTAEDTNGNQYYRFVTTHDVQGPLISNITTPVLAANAAVVVWSTDEPATTQMSFGTEAGVYTSSTALDSTLSTVHVVSLSGLSAATEYHFKVSSRDDAGNQSDSGDNALTTPSAGAVQIAGGSGSIIRDGTPPVISSVRETAVGPFDATIGFEANEDAVGFVEYGPDPNHILSAGDSQYGVTHAVKLAGLRLGTDYHYRIKAIDRWGNLGTSEEHSFRTQYFSEASATVDQAGSFKEQAEDALASILPSLVPPFVSDVAVTEVTETGAVVKWKTNVRAYGVVSYAAAGDYQTSKDKPYTDEQADTGQKTAAHAITLANLLPNTVYHLAVKSFSVPEVSSRSEDISFTTKAPKAKAEIAEVGNNSLRIIWRTSEPASSVVEYRNTATKEGGEKKIEALQTYHDLKIENLAPATLYSISAKSMNEKGNVIDAGNLTVRTTRDLVAPEISKLRIESALIPGKTDRVQTVIAWETDESANSTVVWEEGSGNQMSDLAQKIEDLETWTTDHRLVSPNLKQGGIYRIQVISADQAGNITKFPVRTIVVPRQSESVVDVIMKNFEGSFQFLWKLR